MYTAVVYKTQWTGETAFQFIQCKFLIVIFEINLWTSKLQINCKMCCDKIFSFCFIQLFDKFGIMLKVTVQHFRKIALMANLVFIIGTIVFISPRYLEPVELAKNLAQNRIISISSSFEHRILDVFKHIYFEYSNLYK